MLSKKIKFLTVMLLPLVVLSCSKKNTATAECVVESKKMISDSEEKVQKVNSEIEKLQKVLSGMSDKAKAAIPNGKPEEFLSDLHNVLEAEKSFPSDDKSLYILIDKTHPVSSDYVPANLTHLVKNNYYTISRNDLSLRPDVEKALVEMSKAAQADGITLLVSSTYRSYDYQKKVYAKWVAIDGQEEADRESARPGTSQHQMGSAIDFGTIDDSFAETRMCKWLDANSEKYGWSLSFPQGYEDVTGYRWECWHFRYIGVEACKFQKKWFGNIQQFMFEFIDSWKKA